MAKKKDFRDMTISEMGRLGAKARFKGMTREQISEANRAAGKLGGPARRDALTAKQRTAIARKAAQARWKKKHEA